MADELLLDVNDIDRCTTWSDFVCLLTPKKLPGKYNYCTFAAIKIIILDYTTIRINKLNTLCCVTFSATRGVN